MKMMSYPSCMFPVIPEIISLFFSAICIVSNKPHWSFLTRSCLYALTDIPLPDEPYRIKILNTINFKKSMHYNPYMEVELTQGRRELTEDDAKQIRACLKNHSCNLHVPLCGIFYLHSVDVARYAALIQATSPTNCDAHLAESLFQTRSSVLCKKYVDCMKEELMK